MKTWIKFSERLPRQDDADGQGDVELLETNGQLRIGLWNWVREPHIWETNGFVAWRRIDAAKTEKD